MSMLKTELVNSSNTKHIYQAPHKVREAGIDEIASELVRELQRTLNIEQLLSQFLASTAQIIAPMNCHLTTEKEQFSVSRVTKAHHKVNYHLTLEGRDLGKIEFSRDNWFDEQDLKIIETLLGDLVFPLRNGLDYQDALNAAMTDALTKAANKRAFDYQLHQEFALSQRYGSALSVAILDIDFFKKVNDTYGHAAGDAVLKQVVEVVNNSCRNSDQLFRLGGEEFGLLLTKTEEQGAFIIADRIRATVANTVFCYNGQRIPISISIGVATYGQSESKISFIERADQALYRAKNGGRNKTILAASLDNSEKAPSISST